MGVLCRRPSAWFNSTGRYNCAQHRQRPRPRRERELHVDRQRHPFVPPHPDHVAVRRAAGVVMTPLAIDLLALVLRRGVVCRTNHRLVRGNQLQHHRRQNLGQRPARPDPTTKHAVKIGPMSLGQWPHGPQHAGDGAMPQGEDRAEKQDEHALESWTGECYRERRDERLRRSGKTEHIGLHSGSLDCDNPRMYGGVRFVWSPCS